MKMVVLMMVNLMIGALTVDAALVIKLGAYKLNEKNTTFTFNAKNSKLKFNGGAFGAAAKVVENDLYDISGSFTVSWSATQNLGSPELWQFGSETATIDMIAVGWGVTSGEEQGGMRQLMEGEAILLRFDLSRLTVPSGYVPVFSVQTNDDESYRIYQRTAQGYGNVVASISHGCSGSSPVVPLNGILEFAITDAGYDAGMGLRVSGFSVDIVPADFIDAPLGNEESEIEMYALGLIL